MREGDNPPVNHGYLIKNNQLNWGDQWGEGLTHQANYDYLIENNLN